MSLTSVKASLSIYGDPRMLSAARVTTALDIEPTKSHELGVPHPTLSLAERGLLTTNSYWHFEEPRTIAVDEDPHGMESLVRLAERFEPKAEALAALKRDGYEIRVWMFGSSDSTQAGFVIGPETMRRLGKLSASFTPDIYLDEFDTMHVVESTGR